ncbi:MAG TPA: hypothetical protein VM513_19450 [Kofleriaceae bacterium]|jgi:hypothetical protein|nr:hypothetical protein [Kofleriaceae bacterium]
MKRGFLFLAVLVGVGVTGCKKADKVEARESAAVGSGSGSGSAVPSAVGSGSAADSGSASGSGSAAAGSADTASTTLFDENRNVAFSAAENRVAFVTSHSEEGNDIFTDVSISDLDGKVVENPELPGTSADDYEAKYAALQQSLVKRGFAQMTHVAWPEKKNEVTAGGHTFVFKKTKATSKITVDGKPFVEFTNETTHMPSPTSVAFMPDTRVAYVEINQDAGSNYGEFNNFSTGKVAKLPETVAPFTK